MKHPAKKSREELMKQVTDNKTMELPMPGAKRGRGRPSTGNAMTNAERQAAFKARRKALPKPDTQNDTRKHYEQRTKLENALAAAEKTIQALQKENSLLIAERASAFKAADQAKAELGRITKAATNTGNLASEVLRLENALHQVNADNRRLELDADTLEKKVYEYQEIIEDLTAKLNKRNASRKSTT